MPERVKSPEELALEAAHAGLLKADPNAVASYTVVVTKDGLIYPWISTTGITAKPAAALGSLYKGAIVAASQFAFGRPFKCGCHVCTVVKSATAHWNPPNAQA